jgi:hypothetical protein
LRAENVSASLSHILLTPREGRTGQEQQAVVKTVTILNDVIAKNDGLPVSVKIATLLTSPENRESAKLLEQSVLRLSESHVRSLPSESQEAIRFIQTKAQLGAQLTQMTADPVIGQMLTAQKMELIEKAYRQGDLEQVKTIFTEVNETAAYQHHQQKDSILDVKPAEETSPQTEPVQIPSIPTLEKPISEEVVLPHPQPVSLVAPADELVKPIVPLPVPEFIQPIEDLKPTSPPLPTPALPTISPEVIPELKVRPITPETPPKPPCPPGKCRCFNTEANPEAHKKMTTSTQDELVRKNGLVPHFNGCACPACKPEIKGEVKTASQAGVISEFDLS